MPIDYQILSKAMWDTLEIRAELIDWDRETNEEEMQMHAFYIAQRYNELIEEDDRKEA